MDGTAQQDDLQSARLRDLGIGVTPNEQVRPKFQFTEKNLKANGFKEKTKPMGFFTCLALGYSATRVQFLLLSGVCVAGFYCTYSWCADGM